MYPLRISKFLTCCLAFMSPLFPKWKLLWWGQKIKNVKCETQCTKAKNRIKEKKKKTFEEYLPRYVLQCTSAVIPLRQSNVTDITWDLLLLLLSCFSRVRLRATPETAARQASPSLGFSRQEHWSGLPFPSPMHEGKK